jgi:hypothetical protein
MGRLNLAGLLSLMMAIGCESSITPADDGASAAISAPVNLTAQAVAATEVDLTWGAGYSRPANFLVLRGSSAATLAQIAEVSGSTTQLADATVVAASTYYYQVVAVSRYGRQAGSAIASVTTPADGATPPPPPADAGVTPPPLPVADGGAVPAPPSTSVPGTCVPLFLLQGFPTDLVPDLCYGTGGYVDALRGDVIAYNYIPLVIGQPAHIVPSNLGTALVSTDLVQGIDPSNQVSGVNYARKLLPPGIQVDTSTGTIAGTPTQFGTYGVLLNEYSATSRSSLGLRFFVACASDAYDFSTGTCASSSQVSRPVAGQKVVQITSNLPEFANNNFSFGGTAITLSVSGVLDSNIQVQVVDPRPENIDNIYAAMVKANRSGFSDPMPLWQLNANGVTTLFLTKSQNGLTPATLLVTDRRTGTLIQSIPFSF